MNIKELNEKELKAIAYDLIKNIQSANKQLMMIENEIMNKQKAMNIIKVVNKKSEPREGKKESKG